MKPLILIMGMLTASSAFAGTTSEPPRDPRIYGDHQHGHMMQPCGPGYSVGHYPRGEHLNPQDFCGGDSKPRASGGKREDPVPPTHPRPPKEPPKDRKDKGNNGWGNGSQDAPGASGPRNNAENGPKGKNDGRGKDSGNSGRK